MARYEVKDHTGTTVAHHITRKEAIQSLGVVRFFSKTAKQANACQVVAFMIPKNSSKLQVWHSA